MVNVKLPHEVDRRDIRTRRGHSPLLKGDLGGCLRSWCLGAYNPLDPPLLRGKISQLLAHLVKSNFSNGLKWAAALLMLLFVSCAKDIAPPGGPPDTAPPTILATTPVEGDTLISVDANIRIMFSERIQAKAAASALFISPPLKAEPRVKAKGAMLIIDPAENLEPDKTYVVTIGASLADQVGNRMISSSAFAFSTGSHIDSATVRGIVYSQFRPEPNFRVFAYEVKPWLYDSLFAVVPDYITESGKDGHFEFKYLRPGEYLVLGVEDKDRDNKINGESERVALPNSTAIAMNATDSTIDYSLYVSRYDSLNFALANCRGMGGAVTIEFSGGKLDPVTVNSDSIRISSRNREEFAPKAAVVFEREPNKLRLWSERLLPDSTFHVRARGLLSMEGRRLDGDTASCDVLLREADEEKPTVISRSPAADRSLMLPSETLSVTYSEPIAIQNGAATIVVDSTISIGLQAVAGLGTEYRFIPEDSLPANRRLKFVVDNRRLTDLYGNSPADSLFQFDFTVTSPDSLGLLTGTIQGADTVTFQLLGLSRKMKYTFTHMGTGHYRWQLYPDSYTLYAFADQNHNKRWDLGTLSPLSLAERGWIVADTIKIRARFEREGFDLDLR
jgi:hypothetical protein